MIAELVQLTPTQPSMHALALCVQSVHEAGREVKLVQMSRSAPASAELMVEHEDELKHVPLGEHSIGGWAEHVNLRLIVELQQK